MYRDVKKKLLSVALCICMIIGMVQVVPRAKAAVEKDPGGYYVFDAYDNTNFSDIKVRVYIDALEFEYNGSAQGPQITSVTKLDGTPIYDGWSLTGATATEMGDHEATVVGGTVYRITSTDTKIKYSIVPARIYNVTCDDLDTVMWNSVSSIPDVTGKVKVSLAADSLYLDNSQVQVEKISGGDSGPARARITVTDNEHFNLSESTKTTVEKDYTIAYNLGGSESAGTSEYTMSLKSTSVTYNGQPQVPVVELKQGSSTVNFNSNLFNITYADSQGLPVQSIVETGTYTVRVSPRNNIAIINNGGDVYFANRYEGKFTVNPLSFDKVTVKLGNEILWQNGDNVTTPEYAYVAGNETRIPIENITIKDENNQDITNKFAVSWDGDRGIGLAKMILTPKVGSNYPTDQTIQVKYLIKSGLNIDTLTFGTTQYSKSDEIHRPYTGSVVSLSGITVKNDAGVLLNGVYTVSYAYEKNNKWIPITEHNTDYLKTAGKKKVIVTGLGGFAGQSDEKEYTVDVVSMDSEPFRSSFKLEITDSAPFYYKNSAWTPAYSFTYENQPVSASDYCATWANNTNAGTATLTVTAIGGNFTGSKSVSFQISPIDIGDAEIMGSPYTYSGDSIHPTVVVSGGAYGSGYNYTLREGVDYNIVTEDDELFKGDLPKDAKATAYTLRIQPKSDNITGETRDLVYYINPKNINEATGFQLQGVNGENREIEWNGGNTHPELIGSALIAGEDYLCEYSANANGVTAVSGASVTITGVGNYTGTKILRYTITQRRFSQKEGSKFSISAVSSGKVDTGYDIKLTVKDDARATGQKTLSLGTDYTVKELRYYNDETSKWEEVTSGGGVNYSIDNAADKITGLKRAGKYEITIQGEGSYVDELVVEASCGIDISGYRAYINIVSESSILFDGNEHKPTSFSLYDTKDKQVAGITYNNTDPDASDFHIDYERTDGGVPINVAAGKIYVVAIGNPKKGYYGTTAISEKEYSSYTITAPIWSQGQFEIIVATNGGITYKPEGATLIPHITVVFEGTTLTAGKDYELRYDEKELQSAGLKTIYIDGINNYDDQANKNWPAQYEVAPVNVSSSAVTIIPTATDYTDINQGGVTLIQANYPLQEGKDKDYTKDLIRQQDGTYVSKEGDKYYVYFRIEGHGNYTGEAIVKVPVKKVNLSPSQATFAASKKEAKAGEFYVEWNQAELLIKDAKLSEDQRKCVTPSAFRVVYKLTDTDEIVLKLHEDYEIPSSGYGTNRIAGNQSSNYVTIDGIGGYDGSRQLKFTLYTLMTDAETTDTSLIANNKIITKAEWQKAYQQEAEAGLLKLKPLSFDEQRGYVDPSEYTFDWETGFDLANPDVGKHTVIVNGGQTESHYYYGSITLNFTIVDGIENAEILVGTNDTVTYQGKDKPVCVTQSGIGITVTVDGRKLDINTDFVITDYAGNDSIGTATVFLKGIGKYSGTAQHDFKVTYPLNSMVVYMKDTKTDEWKNCSLERVQYTYTGNPIEPEIKLYCPLDKPENGDYLSIEPIPSTMYGTPEYVNNVNAGTGSVVIKGVPFFTDGTADPKRYVNFTIGVASICPPSRGGTVNYRSSKYGNVENIVAEYMGENYTAEDLGITLHDQAVDLVEGKDYNVYYDGDTLNVSDQSALPMITFTGAGNYKGSEHMIQFTIAQKSLGDASITVSPTALTYTDNALEQQIIDRMNVVLRTPKGREQRLVCGTDFEIEKYYTDAECNRQVSAASGVQNAAGTYYIPSAQGTYYAKLQGKGNFKGTRVARIDITQRDLTGDIKINFIPSADSDCTIDYFGEPDCTYNGSEHFPAVEVTYGISNVRLIEERDYTVSYKDNTNAGTQASVTVKMITGSNYVGEATRYFTIKPKDITGADMSYCDSDGKAFQDEAVHEWTKNPVRPSISINDKSLNVTLTQGVVDGTTGDYLVKYEDDNDDDNTQCNAGQVTMTVKGQGNYTGEKVFTYYIGEDISQCYTRIYGQSSTSVEYNGLVQAPPESAITVIAGAGTDLLDANNEKRYDIAYYKDNFQKSSLLATNSAIVDSGTYYIAVVGVPSKGTYAKSDEHNSCKLIINPRSIAPSYVLVSGYDGTYYYTGQQICPTGITVEDTDLPVSSDENDPQRRTVELANGIDYTLTYENNTSAGKASIVVTGKGNYTGRRVAYFNIISSNADGNNTWDGSSEGTGSISDGKTTIAASDIILGYDNSTYNCMMYNGYERIPTVNIAGFTNNDFIVTASNNVQPGIATLTIIGKGTNFTGTITKNFKIKADLSTYGKISAIGDQTYTGSQITPHVTVTCGRNVLNQGSDFTVSYMNNVNVGRATVMATANSDSYYVGTATGSFNISNTAGGMEITGYASTYTYTGNAITPDVIVTMNGRTLTRGTDYIVTYSNNTNVGTATMTINGIGSFSGTKTISYMIEAKNIENCLTTAVTNYQYTGSTYTPNVTVTDSANGKTLVAGTDYTITYSNNTNPGTATITVTALSNNYTGSKVISFKITSAAVSGLRTSTIKNNSIKLAWTTQDYADGYQICNSSNRVVATTNKNSYTVKGLTSCTTYKFKVRSYVENADGSISYGGFSTAVSAKTLLNTPTLKAKSTSKGKVTLTWTKISKATGYEIYYSTKKNGVYTRLKTVSKSSARKYVDSGLASGEKYYYTIRAYRTSNGVKTYSNYNTIKAVKVK